MINAFFVVVVVAKLKPIQPNISNLIKTHLAASLFRLDKNKTLSITKK